MRKIIPYGRQDISQHDVDEVIRTLKSDWLTQGPKTEEFEKAFAEYVGAKYAVSCSSATAALHIAVQALKKDGPGKKVITTPITFAASSNAALYNNLEVDFVDIDPKTYLMDMGLLEERLKKNPNAYQGVVPVSYAGYPVDTEALKKLADKYGLWIVEDACHAPGAHSIDSKGKKRACGGAHFTDAGIFSFHPVKHIATGEGGMVVLNDERLYKRVSMLRTHGITKDGADFVNPSHGGWYHEMQELGFNYRMSELHAALGISQLKRMDGNLKDRNLIASRYDKFLSKYEMIVPFRDPAAYHAFHLYVVQTDRRDKFFDYLRYRGILCQVHYLPVYWHPYYQKLGFKKGLCPKAEEFYSRCVSLPMYPSISEADFSFVLETIDSFFKNP